MKKLTLAFTASVIILFASSCSERKQVPASGEDDRIFVIADSLEYMRIQSALDSVFRKVIYTPQPETTFYLIRKDFDELDNIRDSQNIIVAAPLGSSSDVSQYVGSTLAPQLKASVKNNSRAFFSRFNLWQQNQLVMILTSKDIEELKNNIYRHGTELFTQFQKVSRKRLFDNLYNPQFENRKLESKFLKEYGWIIYVQKDYELVLDKPEDNFVWLRSMPNNDLAKWIFVHWIDNVSPDFLDPDSIASERDALTAKYLKPAGSNNFVRIAEDYSICTDVNFNNHYALMTNGLWEMSDKSMGGPFINYSFYDEKNRRLYIIDASVYAPNYMKKGLIQQLDVILQSFFTSDQLPPERKTALLKEYK